MIIAIGSDTFIAGPKLLDGQFFIFAIEPELLITTL